MSGVGQPDPRIKIEWAKKHIDNLNTRIDVFLAERPYRVIEDLDPQTGKQIYRIEILADIPLDIVCIAGDAIHNLRASLDHLVYRLTPPTVTWTRQHGFPVAWNANEYKARSPGKIKGLPQSLVDRIDALKPYKGGNDAIWRLHELNNIDKHRLLLTFAIAHDRNWLDWRMAFINVYPVFGMPRRRRTITPVQDRAILIPGINEPNVDVKENFAFLIAFNEPQIIEPEPVVPTLLQFADLAEGIIALFDDIA